MGNDIGIDNRDAELLEDIGHGRFAAANAACQPDHQRMVISAAGW